MRKKAFRSLEAYNQIWIITAWDRTINCADCLGCRAGLTESCLLIASVLFYLEAWTKVDRKLSCTQLKCPLVLPSSANKVEYSRVRDISFKSAKKMQADLDETIENLNEGLQVSRTRKSSLEVAFKNRWCQRRCKWKWKVWPQQMQNKACVAELGAPCWFDIEGNVDNLYSWFINYLFFGLDFFP